MAEMLLSLVKLEGILDTCEEAAAMDIEAERSTPFIVSKAAKEIAQWQERKDVINRMRLYLEGSKVWVDKPSSIHPFCTLRASPDIIANTWEVLNNAKKVLHDMINGHQGNPGVVWFWNSDEVNGIHIGPVCSFDSTRLFCAH
jgi:histidine ammonia-lyase